MQSGGVCTKQLSQLQLCVTGHEEDGGVLVGDSNNTELAHQFMKSVGKLLKKALFCTPAEIIVYCTCSPIAISWMQASCYSICMSVPVTAL